jgi:prepilin-type N-terminal cleavage/methylation domain-containing protein
VKESDEGRTSHGLSRQAGFSLLELIVVTAIIGAIAAFAIPNLLTSRKLSNEASTIGALRSISSAQNVFRVSDLDGDGEPNYATEAQMDSLELLEVPSGHYLYSMSLPANRMNFTVLAWPARETNGDRSFFLDDSGVIRFTTTGMADKNSPPIGD